jgi:hypothetical protein
VPESRLAAAFGSRWGGLWLLVLALVCATELLTHTGSRAGFLQSSGPLFSPNDTLPAEGYVSWVGEVPVLHDSDGILTLVSLFRGQRGPEETGILDRRAAYAYLASLAVPWAGAYAGFMLVNFLFWWGAAAAAFWFVRHRWRDAPLAVVTSLLVATGNGFLFMAGTPMSYLAAYASVMLLLALGEWLGAFAPAPSVQSRGAQLRAWLLLGWGAGVASTIYFAHLPMLIFWWVYGLRRVPWRCLLAATAVVFAVSFSWDAFGTAAVGLGFTTDNSAAVGGSVGGWIAHLHESWLALLTYFRAATVRGTLVGAFPYPWWALAALGFALSSRADREWALAVAMAGLIPTIALLSLLALPRAAFYMYPAVYLMAARGALVCGRAVAHGLAALSGARARSEESGPWAAGRRWAIRGAPPAAVALRPPALAAGAAVTVLAIATLVMTSNADLLGNGWLNARFHFSAGSQW